MLIINIKKSIFDTYYWKLPIGRVALKTGILLINAKNIKSIYEEFKENNKTIKDI